MKVYKLHIYIAVCFYFILLSSCSKWLDVQPEDRFTEEQVFSTHSGFENAINGVYLGLADNDLYGAQLSMTTLDILAQRYKISDISHQFYTTVRYGYNEVQLRTMFDQTWKKMYTHIANTNKIIENVNKNQQLLTANQRDKLLGETYGMRAFLHFDLLRMFGPIYNSSDSLSLAIPFKSKILVGAEERLPANKVMEMIIADLKKAETLLEAVDPIITQGQSTTQTENSNNWRNYRMNYFAVLALQSRVYLWKNDKVAAFKYARKVIDQQEKFPWVTKEVTLNESQNQDRIFSKELIFSLEVPALYRNYEQYFNPNLQSSMILCPSAEYLTMVYQGIENDFRYSPSWKVPGSALYYKTFYKYADVPDVRKEFRNTVPLIRISEMYYIAAECAADETTALNYLNTVRTNRNISSLLPGVDLRTELLNEYRREFFGEGQLWFYYKRSKALAILSSNSTTLLNIDPALYLFPIPKSEVDLNE